MSDTQVNGHGGKRAGAGRPKTAIRSDKPVNSHGGARDGAGRPAGRKNDTTLAREDAVRAATLAAMAELGDNALAVLTPLEILRLAARIALEAGDLPLAMNAADKAAPYVHAKKAIEGQAFELPPGLQPDGSPPPGWVRSASGKLWPDDSQPPAISDEPGPPGGVIE